MPGAALVSQLINWLMWVSLMASLGAVLYGAAMWRGGAKMGNTPRAEDGRNYVAGGAVGALLAGSAVVLINTLFEVGRAGVERCVSAIVIAVATLAVGCSTGTTETGEASGPATQRFGRRPSSRPRRRRARVPIPVRRRSRTWHRPTR
jgi:hypothetical protein